MTIRAQGTFEVELTPQPQDDGAISRMSIAKRFQGDLEATSQGTMLAVGPDAKGSGGYVAMERVSGTLHGRKGTFALQHSGAMTRGASSLAVIVAPDSGAGELAGLAGEMDINIADGKHFYDFAYTLAETSSRDGEGS